MGVSVENILFKVLSFVLLVGLLFVAPLYNMLLRQDIMILQTVNYSVEKLADSARECGYITFNMYNDFLNEIYSTGMDYKVKMKHYEKYYFDDKESFTADYLLFTDEILEDINNEGIYYFHVGDMFVIEVISESDSLGMSFTHSLTGMNTTPVFSRAGGMILNENN